MFLQACSAFLVSTLAASAAAAQNPQPVPLTYESFDFEPSASVDFVKLHGRETMCFSGTALLEEISQRRGAIEVDIANSGRRSFANLVFHAEDHETYEAAYVRLHKSGSPDAVQYTPDIHGETNWQLFANYQIAATFGNYEWLTLRVDFDSDQARVRVRPGGSTERHEMLVNDLVLDRGGDRIGLSSLFGACFSHLRIWPEPDMAEVSFEASRPSLRPGAIQTWQLSPVFEFTGFATEAPPAEADWMTAHTEPDGLLLISRHRSRAARGGFEENPVDIVYASVVLDSDNAGTILLAVDASDRARIYLNGEPLVEFDNSFRAKGPLFRGDFDPRRQIVMLPLEVGRNELTIGVAERANGWGVSAYLIDPSAASIAALD